MLEISIKYHKRLNSDQNFWFTSTMLPELKVYDHGSWISLSLSLSLDHSIRWLNSTHTVILSSFSLSLFYCTYSLCSFNFTVFHLFLMLHVFHVLRLVKLSMHFLSKHSPQNPQYPEYVDIRWYCTEFTALSTGLRFVQEIKIIFKYRDCLKVLRITICKYKELLVLWALF